MEKTGELFAKIAAGDLEAVRALVTKEPPLASARRADGVSAVAQARYQSRMDIVDALLEGRPALDIFEASMLGRLERVRQLLNDTPGLATAWSADGFTPLHFAAFFGTLPVARLLLERGADPDAPAKNPMGVRPLHSAAAAGSQDIVEILLDHGANVNARQQGGWTPLHSAANGGRAAMVEALLDRKADPRAANDEGKTAVDIARAKGHDAIVPLIERYF